MTDRLRFQIGTFEAGRRWSQILTTALNHAVANGDRMFEVPIWHLKTGRDAVTICDRIAQTRLSQVAPTSFKVAICDLGNEPV
jgi:hypothetical protein